MSGWTNKGRAKPGWMQCPHIAVNGLCTGCGATEIPGWRQNQHTSRGAVPLSEAQPVITIRPGDLSHLKGDADSGNRFMHGAAHIQKDAA